ncbi:thiolase family protein [Aquihabitans sp. G128]|uniref:thiolase family protein n=1 Tax=Aquihabitans sp. G128 TaxID=2849779 RepID=UPI001C24AA1F|nr:thiolase family protein [Aquihabitans sp. G128]QXC59444.1 thiolase family protein [Aquihabitans sp. G128]
MTDAVIIDAVRTPLGKGKPNGALAGVNPVDLLAHPLEALVERTGLDPEQIDDVIAGCVTQADEQGFNIARRAVLAAGYPERVPATTIDRQCGSSQQAIHFAAQGIQAGAYDVVVAAGVESMSRVPMGANTRDADVVGEKLAARYPDGAMIPQGIAAELIAARWGIDREALDAFAVRSQSLAAAARDEGRFDAEIAPLKVAGPDGELVELATDEGIRESTAEGLAKLRPAFEHPYFAERFPQIDWSTTAANSSQLTDGAAAVLLTSAEKAAELGLRPRARIHTTVVEGDDPLYMLTAVIPATRKVLAKAGLTIDDIDLFEVNEAFSSVVLAWAKELGADLDKVNVNGGAIALGHPLGGSGARLATTLLNALEQRGARYGLQVMCEAGGLANAMIIERLD